MARKKARNSPEINASSMADIAFLLLIFFLVTTTIASNKGLTLLLPPKQEGPPPDVKVQERNVFTVLVNSRDQLLVEGQPLTNVKELRNMVKKFITNNGKDKNSSDNPEKAVVSFKTDRGTSYSRYISVLDEVQGAYYEVYGERVGLTAEEFRALDKKKPDQLARYEQAREGMPMNISIAEPSKIGGQ